MAAYDQPLAFITFAIFLLLLLLLIVSRINVPHFGAASLPVLILFLYFSVGYRITEMSLASGTIKLAADQAQKYAAEIRDIRNKVAEEENYISKANDDSKLMNTVIQGIDRVSSSATSKLAQSLLC